MNVYCLYDRKLESYLQQLYVVQTDAAAARGVVGLQGSGQMPELQRHPEDFDLVFVCEFDPLSGHVNGASYERTVANVRDLLDMEDARVKRSDAAR